MPISSLLPFVDFYSYAHGAFSHYDEPEPWFVDAARQDHPTTGVRIHLDRSAAAAVESLITEDDLRVHGRMAPGGNVRLPETCKYCRGPLEAEHVDLPSIREGVTTISGVHKGGFAEAVTCLGCGWWKLCKYRRTEVVDPFSPLMSVTAYFFEAIIHDFASVPSKQSIRVLRQQIQRKHIDLRSISPLQLELLVGEIMRDYHGCAVHHVGGPGDGGIDLLVSEGKNPIAIQVKRRLSAVPSESVTVVRHLLGSMLLEGYKRGIVVSTARAFSTPAKEAARTASQTRPYRIELYNYDKLMELLNLTAINDLPWKRLLEPPPFAFRVSASLEASFPRLHLWLKRRITQRPSTV